MSYRARVWLQAASAMVDFGEKTLPERPAEREFITFEHRGRTRSGCVERIEERAGTLPSIYLVQGVVD